MCFLFLAAFAGAVGAFAYFNHEPLAVRFFDWSQILPLAAVAGIAYGLGTLSGWSVVGLVRRSIDRVTEPHLSPSERRAIWSQ